MRLKTIILTDLINRQLKAQENIERALNSTDDINEVCNHITSNLEELVKLELMISKWQTIISDKSIGDEHKT